MTTFPARIHVLLAREAPIGLVIRRGPSKQVATLLWDRERDEFQMGQWLKGRIYERRCDLSPDGRYFIYFAMNGKWHTEAKGAYTAISRAPWLKAIALFPKGDCWLGGGLWTDERTYWLNGGGCHSILRDTHEVRRDETFTPSEYFGGECLSVYYPRLLRDGWHIRERLTITRWSNRTVFEKPLEHGWCLRKVTHSGIDTPEGKGCYWDEHVLRRESSDIEIDCSTWEWADVDRERLVWASEGKLFAGRITAGGLVEESELVDFNPMTFESIKAPV